MHDQTKDDSQNKEDDNGVGDHLKQTTIVDLAEPGDAGHATGRAVAQNALGQTTEYDIGCQSDDHGSQFCELGHDEAVQCTTDNTGSQTCQDAVPDVAGGVVDDTQNSCRQTDIATDGKVDITQQQDKCHWQGDHGFVHKVVA